VLSDAVVDDADAAGWGWRIDAEQPMTGRRSSAAGAEGQTLSGPPRPYVVAHRQRVEPPPTRSCLSHPGSVQLAKALSFANLEGQVEDAESLLVPVAAGASTSDLAKRLYTAPELMRLAGMSRKQVTYWAQIGLVAPCFHDSKATGGRPSLFYSATEVVKAMIICELKRRGITLRQVQEVAKNLQESQIDLYESQAYLLTDGYSVYYAFDDGQVVDVLKNHRQLLLLVPIHEHVERLRRVA
jgi:DNA-binding transcriptional MerR regulator